MLSSEQLAPTSLPSKYSLPLNINVAIQLAHRLQHSLSRCAVFRTDMQMCVKIGAEVIGFYLSSRKLVSEKRNIVISGIQFRKNSDDGSLQPVPGVQIVGTAQRRLNYPNGYCRLACSERSDSGERCRVKKAMKSRGGSFLLRTAPQYLNAWNRLLQVGLSSCYQVTVIIPTKREVLCCQSTSFLNLGGAASYSPGGIVRSISGGGVPPDSLCPELIIILS